MTQQRVLGTNESMRRCLSEFNRKPIARAIKLALFNLMVNLKHAELEENDLQDIEKLLQETLFATRKRRMEPK